MFLSKTRSAVRTVIVFVVSLYLSAYPAVSLPISGRASKSISKTQRPSSSTQAKGRHRDGEVIVKFRDGVSPIVKQQIVETWGIDPLKNKGKGPNRSLRGRSGSEQMKLRAGMAVSQAVADLKNLDNVIDWVEPNYLVGKTDLVPAKRLTAPSRRKLVGVAPRKALPAAVAKMIQAGAATNDPQFSGQWSLSNIGQNGGNYGSDIKVQGAWGVTTGDRRTTVAIIDTGLDVSHSDLKANVFRNLREFNGTAALDDDQNGYVDDRIGWNFVANTNNVTDDNGHGTHMAGIVAAVGNNNVGISGVMWNASILPLKALDAQGTGTISDVVEAIDYAIAQKVSVILCAFGTDGNSKALKEAIDRAAMSGIIVVTSAGNDGQNLHDSPQFPACYTSLNLLTVAASGNTDNIATFSNYGQGAHIAAPGVDILTTGIGDTYGNITGSSASAALGAGVAGLLKSLRPWVSAQAVRASIVQGARQLGWLNGNVSSSGILSASEAIEQFLAMPEDGVINTGSTGSGGTSDGSGGLGASGPGASLDSTRENRPNTPEPRVKINTLPPSGYDDPMPTGSSNFSAYYTELSKTTNDTGAAGSKPLQMVDPTAGGTAVGGFSINMGNQNVNFTAPVLALSGRAGLDLKLGLTYNSLVWAKNPGSSTEFFNADKGFPGPGWRIGFGAIQGINNSGAIGPYYNSVTGKNSFLYIQPDGTRRDLAFNSNSGKYESYDSTYIDFDASTKVLRTMSGTKVTFGVSSTASGDYQFLPTEVKDRNGNYISIYYKSLSNGDQVLDYIIDTLGRRIDFYYQSNRLTEIRQDRNGTLYRFVVIDYDAVSISPSFSGVSQDISGSTAYLPVRITYPTGVNLRFTYNSYGQITSFEKWVPTISGQGSERKIANTQFINWPIVDTTASNSAPYRSEWAENWNVNYNGPQPVSYIYTFSNFTVNWSPAYGTTPQPVPAVRVDEPSPGPSHSISNSGLVQRAELYSSWNQYYPPNPMRVLINTFTSDSGAGYFSNVRPTDSKVSDAYGNAREMAFSYIQLDGVWLVQNKDDLNVPNYGTPTVYRRTSMTYTSYPSLHILGLPLTSTTYAGPGTTFMAKTENVYDETGSYTDSNSQTAQLFINAGTTVQHDDTNYGSGFYTRGNLTSMKQYSTNGTSTRIVSRTAFDTNGLPRSTADASGNRATIDYADNFSNKPSGLGALNALPYLMADPFGMKKGAQYEYYTGHPILTFAQRPGLSTQELVTTMTYDFADRPVRTTSPTGAYTELGYWDNLIRQTTYVKRDVVSGVDQLVYSFQDMDGLGNVIRKGSDHPNASAGKYSGQQFKYDLLRRQTQATNILAVDGNFSILTSEEGQTYASWQYSNTSYDYMNRATQVQDLNGASVFADYSSCGCAGGLSTTVTDQNSQQSQTQKDNFGRLRYARDLTPNWMIDANGYPYIFNYTIQTEVTYDYDVLDRMTTITHRGNQQTSGPGQVRSFTYDEWGRLASETTPEAGTVTYTYTSNDKVATSTSARGITTTYTYNTRNLVTGISYSDGTTPSASFGYDDYGSRTSMTDGEGAMSYSFDSYRRLSSESRTFNGLSGNTYTYNYAYNISGQLTLANYVAPGFNKNINYAYNQIGAMTGMGTNIIGSDPASTSNVISTLTYRAFGKASKVDYGNGKEARITYDTNLMRMTRLVVDTPNAWGSTVRDDSYTYTPNGLIASITNNWDTYYSSSYSYNFRNQLVSTQIGSETWNTEYDDWGNRTYSSRLDAYGGIESSNTYNFNRYMGYGDSYPLTNRIASFYTYGYNGYGTYQTLSYDFSGNPTQSGSTTYEWDGANRMKSVNSGSLGSYGYDGNGKRVRKTEGGVNTYYVYSLKLGAAMEVTPSGVSRAWVMNGSSVIAQLSIDGNFYWMHSDHLGSGRKMTNSSGALAYRAEFDPWGKLLMEWSLNSQNAINSKKFTGYERDAATGLDYAQARLYSSDNGRFMSPDPIGKAGANLNIPQSLNLYQYTQNNPVNRTDPSGLLMAEPQESGCEDQPIESSWGWSLLPCISGGGLDAAWFEEQQQKKKAVTPCTNQVPKDPNRLAVAEVLLGESLGPGYFGQRLYSKDQHGQRNAIGAPNGAYVDREQVEYGMVLMYSALLNRADQDRKTVGREVLDNAGQYDGFSRGVEKLTDPDFATNNPVGGYLSYCDELGWLLDAMDGVDNGGRNPYVLAWVAVVQGNSVRDFYNGSKKGPYDRVGGNDFFTIRF